MLWYSVYGIHIQFWWYWVPVKTYGPKYAKKSLKNPKFGRKNFSRINWGINIVEKCCLSHTILIREEFDGIVIISWFIPFSKNDAEISKFWRLCNSPLRNRWWRHRLSGCPNGQFRAWSTWHWKPFGQTLSTIKMMAKLEWHDFGLKKASKNSIVYPTLKTLIQKKQQKIFWMTFEMSHLWRSFFTLCTHTYSIVKNYFSNDPT